MSGWTNKGRAAKGWMQCPHTPDKGICTACGAIEIDGYVQASHTGTRATTGPDMQPVISSGMSEMTKLRAGPGGADRFMQGKARPDYSQRRHAHSDAIRCADAGEAGHPLSTNRP